MLKDTKKDILGEVTRFLVAEPQAFQEGNDRIEIGVQSFEFVVGFVAHRTFLYHRLTHSFSKHYVRLETALRNFPSGPWRRTLVPFVLFCMLAPACTRESPVKETPSAAKEPKRGNPRVVEAWLTGFDVWQRCRLVDAGDVSVQNVHCGSRNSPDEFVSIQRGDCDAMIQRHEDAIEMLAHAPACTDAAIEKLTAWSGRTPTAELLSDLAGGYLVRARRDDRPADYAHALVTAEAAVKAAADGGRDLPQARFNAALALEGAGFAGAAADAWTLLSTNLPAGWNVEANQHAKALTAQLQRETATSWRENVSRLKELFGRDAKGFEELISPFRASAQNYAENTLLAGGSVPEDRLALAGGIADVLEKLNRDRFLRDTVDAIRNAHDPETVAALKEGHVALTTGRKLRAAGRDGEAAFEHAERAFRRANSPLRFSAALVRVAYISQRLEHAAALKLLRSIEGDAQRLQYPSLLSRVHAGRAYIFFVRGNHFQAIDGYMRAEAIHERLGDEENVATFRSRKIGVLLETGNVEETWRQVVRIRRSTSIDFNARHLLLGETARLFIAMNYPRIGLRVQNDAIRFLQNEINQSNDPIRETDLLTHLGIAFRARASIYARLGENELAKADLAQATPRLQSPTKDPGEAVSIGFEARLAEVRAQTLPPAQRKEATGLLTQAITLAGRTHYQTLLASLLVQRAELHRLDGRRSAAIADLEEAVAALRKEVVQALNPPPDVDLTPYGRLWKAFFSRSEATYRHLIALLLSSGDAGDAALAFHYAEDARAYEPLYRLLQRNELPAAFKKRIRDGRPLRLHDVEETVPEDTYLLQYCVLDDKTYLWLIRHGVSELLTLPVRNDEIAQWTAALHKYADQRDEASFKAALRAPHDALVKEALARVAKLHGEREELPRVVIVPDRAMHGLPFSALHDGTDYVVRRYRFSVTPSSTLYAFALARNAELAARGPESVLLVGDPAFDTTLDIAPGLAQSVPGLRIGRIQQVYKPLVSVQMLERENATAPQLLRHAAGSTVIHLAAHGVVNADIPSRSYFLLAPAEDEAGALDADRLFKELRLQRARLAVLAACSSAGGAAVGPAGLGPLVRPLVISGVPAVVGALWNISDNEETEELLVRFHRHYGDGVDADDALRLAQLEMLDDRAASRNTPRAWGAFQVIGHASSPFPRGERERRRKSK